LKHLTAVAKKIKKSHTTTIYIVDQWTYLQVKHRSILRDVSTNNV